MEHIMDNSNTAYALGSAAYYYNRNIEDCPYESAREVEAWEKGWSDAASYDQARPTEEP